MKRGKLGKLFLGILVISVLIVGMIGLMSVVNGEDIKPPLASYLNDPTTFSINLDNPDFIQNVLRKDLANPGFTEAQSRLFTERFKELDSNKQIVLINKLSDYASVGPSPQFRNPYWDKILWSGVNDMIQKLNGDSTKIKQIIGKITGSLNEDQRIEFLKTIFTKKNSEGIDISSSLNFLGSNEVYSAIFKNFLVNTNSHIVQELFFEFWNSLQDEEQKQLYDKLDNEGRIGFLKMFDLNDRAHKEQLLKFLQTLNIQEFNQLINDLKSLNNNEKNKLNIDVENYALSVLQALWEKYFPGKPQPEFKILTPLSSIDTLKLTEAGGKVTLDFGEVGKIELSEYMKTIDIYGELVNVFYESGGKVSVRGGYLTTNEKGEPSIADKNGESRADIPLKFTGTVFLTGFSKNGNPLVEQVSNGEETPYVRIKIGDNGDEMQILPTQYEQEKGISSHAFYEITEGGIIKKLEGEKEWGVYAKDEESANSRKSIREPYLQVIIKSRDGTQRNLALSSSYSSFNPNLQSNDVNQVPVGTAGFFRGSNGQSDAFVFNVADKKNVVDSWVFPSADSNLEIKTNRWGEISTERYSGGNWGERVYGIGASTSSKPEGSSERVQVSDTTSSETAPTGSGVNHITDSKKISDYFQNKDNPFSEQQIKDFKVELTVDSTGQVLYTTWKVDDNLYMRDESNGYVYAITKDSSGNNVRTHVSISPGYSLIQSPSSITSPSSSSSEPVTTTTCTGNSCTRTYGSGNCEGGQCGVRRVLFFGR